MTFGAPGYLLLLLLVAGATAFVTAWLLWRASAIRRFGARQAAGRSPLVVAALLIVAVAVAAFAAARPQYGERTVPVDDRGIDMVVVLDVSQSMLATDAQPSRLGRSQDEIVALLDRLRGDRIGLVIFGGSAFVRSPLTADLTALSRLVEGVHEERGLVDAGSDLGAAIRTANDLLDNGDADAKAMLIVSDGEDHGGDIAPAIDDARRAGTIVFAAGAGTPQGAAVLDADPLTGELRPRIDASGAAVLTRLDAGALRQMATAGGGRYVELRGDGRPLTALDAELNELGTKIFGQEESATPIERFQIFVTIAIALVVMATILPVAWRYSSVTIRRMLPFAAAGLFAGAICGTSVADINRRGNERFDDSEYAQALDTYRTAQALDGARGELYYNAGNALNRTGDHEGAIDEAKRALPSDHDDLAAKAEYALGNHYVGAVRLIDALEAYKRALLADPSDEDTKHNLEVIAARIDATPVPPEPPTPQAAPTEAPNDGEPEDSGTAQAGEGTPAANATPGEDAAPGTPTSGDASDLSPGEVERLLDEALEGIDEEFTVEEALRVLDLLEQRNRDELAQPPASDGEGAPDY